MVGFASAQEIDEIYTPTEYSTTSTSWTLLNTHTHTVNNSHYLNLYNVQFTLSHGSGVSRDVYYRVTAQADGGTETTIAEGHESPTNFNDAHTVNKNVDFGELDNYGDDVTVRYYIRTTTIYTAHISNMYSRCYVLNATPAVDQYAITPNGAVIANQLQYNLNGNGDSYSTTLYVDNTSVWTGSSVLGNNTITLPADLELSSGNHSWYVNTTGTNALGSASNETTPRDFSLSFYISPDNTTDVQAPPFIHEIPLDVFRHGTYSYDITIQYDDANGTTAFHYNPVVSNRSNNYTRILSLGDGDYYLVVDAQDSEGNTLETAATSFSVSQTFFLNSTSVAGTVYEQRSGEYVKIGSAKVTIYNDTWSNDYVTASNGFYQFTNLTAGQTYYISASKDGYYDTGINIVTVQDGLTSTKNILMQKQDAANYILPHYVQLYVKSLWNTYYPGVTVTVYEGDSATALGTKVTDSTGGVGFELKETVTYRITAYSEELGIDEETTLTPTKDTHNIYVSRSLWDYIDPTPISMEEVEVSVEGQEINATHAYINVSYSDAMSETTDLNIYVKQSNKSDPLNQTTITSHNFGAVSETNHSFIISDYSGKGYFVNVIAEHDTFGTIDRTYSVQFQGMNENFGWSKIWIWLAVGGMIFVAGMFGKESVNQGAITVCVLAWIMYNMGWFSQYNSTSLFMGLSLATVISVASYMNQKSKGEGS